MNGGPGASSLTYGSFSELGPFYFDDHSMENKTEQGVPDVLRNPYSWTRVANMLFIESPPSVGFSYCAKKECRWNDTTTAEVNYAGLAKFFEEFEEYKGREFYIAGESCERCPNRAMCCDALTLTVDTPNRRRDVRAHSGRTNPQARSREWDQSERLYGGKRYHRASRHLSGCWQGTQFMAQFDASPIVCSSFHHANYA